MTNYQLKSNGMPNTIENLLLGWGHSQQQLPSQSEDIKAKILAGFSANKSVIKQSSSPKFNFAWLSLALAGFAAITFFVIPSLKTAEQVKQTWISPVVSNIGSSVPAPMADESEQALSVPMRNNLGSGSSEMWPQPLLPPQTAPSGDTREFLKTAYSASIQTRNVQNLTNRIQTAIRGFGGRVDLSSNSTQSGFIGFVIPTGQLEAFKQEIKGLINYRFYSETAQTQNLLPQKLELEDRQTQTNSTLAQLQSDKNQLTQSHNRAAASLNLQIRTASKQLADLQNQTTTDVNLAGQIEAQKQALANQIKNLQNRLSVENNNYSNQQDSLNNQIQVEQNILDSLNTQTNDLVDNVATVNGTISLSWISLWETFNLYVPLGYWFPGLLLILAVAVYSLNRKKPQFILP